jgi:hypothetical protein
VPGSKQHDAPSTEHPRLLPFTFYLFPSERSAVTLEAFRQRIREQFGPGMERATPQNVREFLDRMQEELNSHPQGGPYSIAEPETSYEGILRTFFAEILDAPHDQAVIQLWLLGLELAFADLQDTIAEEISPLFRPWDEPQ